MRLYGVDHGGYAVDLLTGEVSELFACPSEGLISDISLMPKGSRIGLETLPDRAIGFPEEVKESESTRVYWNLVLHYCNRAGLEIVYLDDPDLIRKQFRHHFREIKVRRASKTLTARNLAYRIKTKAEYILAIEREAKILENIRNGNLAATVVGGVHSDYFFAENLLAPEQYDREVKGFVKNRLIRNADQCAEGLAEIEKSLAEREAIIIRRRAAITGRITDGKPDYIGTWSIEIPTLGLFEMYVDQRKGANFSGTIVDVNGSAVFAGQQTPEAVRFRKVYDSRAVVAGGCESPLDYEGQRRNGRYEGQYGPGYFWMREFDGSGIRETEAFSLFPYT
jgi:hypothetical protein